MAAAALSTSARVVETIMPRREKRISVLFAMRPGITALVDRVGAIAGETGDARDEQAFDRACCELSRLDAQILAQNASCIADIKMQAVVARASCVDGAVDWQTLTRLFESIESVAS